MGPPIPPEISDSTNRVQPENVSCPVCEIADVEVICVPYPFLTHLDYRTIKMSGEIGRCQNCQTLFQIMEERTLTKVLQLLNGVDYARSRQTCQTFTVPEFRAPVTRSFLQAELISRRVESEEPSVLDIGTFDGRLLLELSERFPGARLHGYDVNSYLRASFPSKNNLWFWSEIGAIDEEFDVICLSHSIMYEKEIGQLMRRIKRLIRPRGFLFVQVPNITASPCNLLLGDQYYFYTAKILKNTLQYFGFSCEPIENNWFAREIVCTGHLTTGRREPFVEDRDVHECIRNIENIADRLHALPERAVVSVLGTTANAAFVDSLLGGRVTRFFDENPNRVGGAFRSKEVLHPQSLTESDLLVIPYGESGKRIEERFRREYNGRFYVL